MFLLLTSGIFSGKKKNTVQNAQPKLQNAVLRVEIEQPQVFGGVETQSNKLCESAIDTLTSNLKVGLDQWKVVECRKQVVAGFNYFMKMENLKDKKRNCNLNIYKPLDGPSQITETFNDCSVEIKKDLKSENVIEHIEMTLPEPMIIHEKVVYVEAPKIKEPHLLGGVETKNIESCKTAINSLASNLKVGLDQWKVTECKMQVVAGYKYFMKMENLKDKKRNCNLNIFEPLNGPSEISSAQNSCVDEIKKDLKSENVIEHIEMTLPEPMIIHEKVVYMEAPKIKEPQLLGGVENSNIQNCESALQKIDSKYLTSLKSLKITECKTQVIAGVRYIMKMQDKKNAKKKCNFEVLMTVEGLYQVQQVNDQCITIII